MTGFFDPNGSDAVLVFAAAATSAVWLAAAAVVLVRRRPTEPPVGPRTLDLGPEPPAVANFLVNDFRVTDDAVPATLIDLAAPGVASGASGPLPMGTESDTDAWSAYGGRWRLVRVVYPRLWPPAWGLDPLVAIVAGIGAALAGALALYWLGPALFDAGIFGALLVVPAPLSWSGSRSRCWPTQTCARRSR